MAPKRSTQNDRGDAVLDAAETCYDRKGWSAVTMEEVAGIAGVSRGYIYKHFQNKDGLLLAVLVRRAEIYNRRARQFIAGQSTLSDALVEGIMLGVKIGHRDHLFGRLVAAATSDPEHSIPGAMQAAMKATEDLWRPVLAAAAERGELQPGVDVEDVIDWIAMLVVGLLANRNALGVSDDVQERQLRTLFVPAVVRPTARTTVEVLEYSAGRS